MAAIDAVYENGVFRPTGPVHLAEGAAVRVEAVPGGRPAASQGPDHTTDVRALVDGGGSL